MDDATRLYAIGGGIAVLALLLAGYFGVHHWRWINGPERLMAGEQIAPLWMAAVMGFIAFNVPVGIYLIVNTPPGAGPTTGSTTALATQPVLSPRATALLAFSVPSAVLIAAVATCAATLPSWRRRLGVAPDLLPRGFMAGAIAILVVLPVMFIAANLTQDLWSYLKVEHPNAHSLLRAMNEDRETWVQGLIMFSAIVMAPVSEELLFRGLLQTAILYSLNRSAAAATRWAAIGIASVVFTLYHGEYWLMPPIFVLSVCLGYLYERTGNLWACILLHAGFNAANVLLFRLQNGH